MEQIPAIITQTDYDNYLDAYIKEQMTFLPEGKKSLKFWTNFNRDKKAEFDQLLANQGTIIQN